MSASYKKYDVCIADVPFEDLPQSKVRPVLILDVETMTVKCLKMTGHPPREGEYALQRWQYAGLHRQTTVRISKCLKLSPDSIRKKTGHLHPIDIMAIQNLTSD